MADRKDYFYRQKVDEADLDAGFSALESSQWAIVADLGYFGVFDGLEVGQHIPGADISVDVEPGVAYDQSGRRISVPARTVVSVATDYAGASTDVVTAGSSRLVGVYAKFDRSLEDRRIDGNSQLVYFSRKESFKLLVAKTEVHPGVADGDWEYWREHLPTPPEEGCVLLAVAWRRPGQTQILETDISYIGRPTLTLDGTRRDADTIDVEASPAWADASAYPVQDLQVRLNAIQRDLADTGMGATLIGAAGIAGSVDDLDLGSVGSQLAQLLGFVNDRVKKSGDEMSGNLVPDATGHDLGSAAARWDAFLENGIVYGSLLPSASGVDLGSPTQRWTGHFDYLTLDNLLSTSSNIVPTVTDAGYLGSAGLRWRSHFSRINLDGEFEGNVTFTTTPAVPSIAAVTADSGSIGAAAKKFATMYANDGWFDHVHGPLAQLQLDSKVVTGAYTVLAADPSYILADASGGAVQVTLPAAATFKGRMYRIGRTSGSAVTIVPASGTFAEGDTEITLPLSNDSVVVLSNGTSWQIADASFDYFSRKRVTKSVMSLGDVALTREAAPIVFGYSSVAGRTLTLPPVAQVRNRTFIIKNEKQATGSYDFTVDKAPGDSLTQLDGSAWAGTTVAIAGTFRVFSDGQHWWTV